jgi:predicted MFS family arabinose efflux permease
MSRALAPRHRSGIQRPAVTATTNEDALKRRSIGFINWAHALDHFVMLIYPTVVIGLGTIYHMSYGELIALGTPSFIAFGVFSLPAGWLGDRWSRRSMMVLFFVGSGLSLLAAALAPNLVALAAALFALGVFASIYHPVGTAILIAQAASRGRSLAFNGVCGNLGVALAAGITALLIAAFGWRGAFLVPALVCIVSGITYLWLVPDDRQSAPQRSSAPDVAFAPWLAATVFSLFVLIALAGGLVFHVSTVALPKIVDERLGADVPLLLVGGLATAIFMCGAVAQLAVGRLVERVAPHLLFAAVALLQLIGVAWAVYASGTMLVLALALSLAAIYAQVTVNDLVIARYTADTWRGRVFAVRYFLSFAVSGAAVSIIWLLHERGGFVLVLATTAAIALALAVLTVIVAALVNGVERERARAPAPAE